MTAAYGVNDKTVTRRRVAADLQVLLDYQRNCMGMKEACSQQLAWGVERYAALPGVPELLAVEKVPYFWLGLFEGLGRAIVWAIGAGLAGGICILVLVIVWENLWGTYRSPGYRTLEQIVFWVWALGIVGLALSGPWPYIRAVIANGKRPQENERRLEAHRQAVAAALKAAEPLKAAEDHRLRHRIMEAEGLISTLGEKEAELRRVLATL